MALCGRLTGTWLGTEPPWDDIAEGAPLTWTLDVPSESPITPPWLFEISNGALLLISDPVRGGREPFALSAGTVDDAGISFVVTEIPEQQTYCD